MFRHWAWSSKKPRRRADDQGRLKGREAQSGLSTREERSKKRGRRRLGSVSHSRKALGGMRVKVRGAEEHRDLGGLPTEQVIQSSSKVFSR